MDVCNTHGFDVSHAWYIYGLAVLGGALAGVINTLAGSGSLVTLPILVALGLPANEANGTNRLGIVFQSLVGLITLKKTDQLETRASHFYVVPCIIGAALGAWVASQLSARVMDGVIFGVMILMLGAILINPKRWLKEESSPDAYTFKPWLSLVFVGIGFYGGFLQAGVGVMLLVGLVLGAGYSLKAGNGIKILIALCFTCLALLIFLAQGLVNWSFGLLMAVGQSIGAWFAARYLMQHDAAPVWVRRLLIVVVVLGIAKFGHALWSMS